MVVDQVERDAGGAAGILDVAGGGHRGRCIQRIRRRAVHPVTLHPHVAAQSWIGTALGIEGVGDDAVGQHQTFHGPVVFQRGGGGCARGGNDHAAEQASAGVEPELDRVRSLRRG
ncbi:hypothetical protein G6F32_015876 [Rhizopus arrhizus]|nr:hypothetical protein G6F32_015876 [Rhizopus arrhizus]